MVPTEVPPLTDKPIAAPELTGSVTWKGNVGEFMAESAPFDFKTIWVTFPVPESFTSYLTEPSALALITGRAKLQVCVPPELLSDLEQEKIISTNAARIIRIIDFIV